MGEEQTIVTSSAGQSGLLLVLMEPPAPLEDEFNAWYDTEHLPQRRSLPGFQSGTRWTCVAGWPRWAAMYELSSTAALKSPDYLAVSGENSTPWSRRILPKTIGYMRVVATALPSPEAIVSASTRTPTSLMIARFTFDRDTVDAGAIFASAAENLKRFQPVSRRAYVESHGVNGEKLWLLATFDYPVDASELSRAAGRVGDLGADLFNLYVPYRK